MKRNKMIQPDTAKHKKREKEKENLWEEWREDFSSTDL